MFTLKHVVVFFILHNTVSPSRFIEESCYGQDYSDSSTSTSDEIIDYEGDGDESPENNFTEFPNNSNEDLENSSTETPENSSTETPKKIFTDICPEDHSIISHRDINYLIEENAEILKIQQHFENSSYPDAEELIQKFNGELEILLKRFIDRPNHMRHILHDMSGLRQKLEPKVKTIVSQLELFHTFEDDINRVVAGSDKNLEQLRKFKTLCQVNCEEIRNRFGQNNNNNPLVLQSAGMYCIKLEDLNNIINEKLSEVQAQHNDSLYVQLEVSEKTYEQKMAEFQTNLKKSAVKLFGMTMYDILSLQDDYHHFAKYLEHINISSETHIIRQNIADIQLRLVGLEYDLERYQQYCLNCGINQRIKPNVFDLRDDSTLNDAQEPFVITEDQIAEVETVVVEIIKVKIDAIRESIKSNLTAMFEDLDRKLSDPEVIDEYVMKLRPIQDEIEKDFKSEHDGLLELKSRIPEASLDKILEFSKKSKQIIHDLESAKQFIDKFISRN